MHPEMSLVFLTVLAGAGQGLFILFIVLDFFMPGVFSHLLMLLTCGVALILQFSGMAASFFHLGNAQKGWKAILKWDQSWLSREVIFLSMFVGLLMLYVLSFYVGLTVEISRLIGFAGLVAAVGFFISSSMVYASVRFIKEWANAYTPINFSLLSLLTGGAILYALSNLTQEKNSVLTQLNHFLFYFTFFALVFKVLAFRYNETTYASVKTKNALGMNDTDIRLMDTGAAYDHYNTLEYKHHIAPAMKKFQERLVLLLTFILPLIVWFTFEQQLSIPFTGGALSLLAAISILIGVIIERRLFFIEGNHVQNLYYGNFVFKNIKNPILSKAKKGTPVPL